MPAPFTQAVRHAADALRALLECPLCKDRFENPHSLPCGHQFCSRCIKPQLEARAPVCPECSTPIEKHVEVVPNQPLASMVEAFVKIEAALFAAPVSRSGSARSGKSGRKSADAKLSGPSDGEQQAARPSLDFFAPRKRGHSAAGEASSSRQPAPTRQSEPNRRQWVPPARQPAPEPAAGGGLADEPSLIIVSPPREPPPEPAPAPMDEDDDDDEILMQPRRRAASPCGASSGPCPRTILPPSPRPRPSRHAGPRGAPAARRALELLGGEAQRRHDAGRQRLRSEVLAFARGPRPARPAEPALDTPPRASSRRRRPPGQPPTRRSSAGGSEDSLSARIREEEEAIRRLEAEIAAKREREREQQAAAAPAPASAGAPGGGAWEGAPGWDVDDMRDGEGPGEAEAETSREEAVEEGQGEPAEGGPEEGAAEGAEEYPYDEFDEGAGGLAPPGLGAGAGAGGHSSSSLNIVPETILSLNPAQRPSPRSPLPPPPAPPPTLELAQPEQEREPEPEPARERVILASNLEGPDKALLAGLVERLGGARLLEINPIRDDGEAVAAAAATATHLVVGSHPSDPRRPRFRTSKYSIGLALGAWIVGDGWLRASEEAGAWADEEAHEILVDDGAEGAPRRSRLAREAMRGIFRGVTVHFLGARREYSPGGPHKNPLHLAEAACLVLLGGGRVRCGTRPGAAFGPSEILVCPRNWPDERAAAAAASYRPVAVLTDMYLVDSVGRGSLLPIRNYAHKGAREAAKAGGWRLAPPFPGVPEPLPDGDDDEDEDDDEGVPPSQPPPTQP
eukprot:tig00021254_g19704.t1